MIPEIKKILYSTDLSENSKFAFSYAASLANRYDAAITILHVLKDAKPTAESLACGRSEADSTNWCSGTAGLPRRRPL